MSVCSDCKQEMRTAESCVGGVDTAFVARVLLDPQFTASRDLEDGKLRPLAGPSLPENYSVSLDGYPIGPSAGSCGTAGAPC